MSGTRSYHWVQILHLDRKLYFCLTCFSEPWQLWVMDANVFPNSRFDPFKVGPPGLLGGSGSRLRMSLMVVFPYLQDMNSGLP